MKLRNILGALAVLVLVPSPAALAQYESSNRSRIGVGMAVIRPSDSVLHGVKSMWLGPAISVHITFDGYDRPDTIATVGWFFEENSAVRSKFFPVSVSRLVRFGKNPDSSWYVGGGLDAYFVSHKAFSYNPSVGLFEWASDNATKFGVNLMVGFELAGGWFGEARYDIVDKLSLKNGGSVDFSGTRVTVGNRMAF